MLLAEHIPGGYLTQESVNLFIEEAKRQGYIPCINGEVLRGVPPDENDPAYIRLIGEENGIEKEYAGCRIHKERADFGYSAIPAGISVNGEQERYEITYRADYIIAGILWDDDDETERELPDIIIMRKRLPWDVVANPGKEENVIINEASEEYGNRIQGCITRNMQDLCIHSLKNGMVHRVTGDRAFK